MEYGGNSTSMMRAMQIIHVAQIGDDSDPVSMARLPVPSPGSDELLLRVSACGVCHTELDEIEGRTPPASLPMTPGHQVVGTVQAAGPDCSPEWIGQRVGVAWIHSACGECEWCASERENLCADFVASGRDAPGGYAEYMVVKQAFAHPIPDSISDAAATPLLCAGAVGYRALQLCRLSNGQSLGLTGFGASGHLVLQMAQHLYPDSPVFVFARSEVEREFALTLGANWAGDTTDTPPDLLHAIIDTTPAWLPVVSALEQLLPGGRLVINAIRKEAGDRERLLELNYEKHLWQEKTVQSVANVTRQDVRKCLELATAIPLRPRVTTYPLQQAGAVLKALRKGNVHGASVLVCDGNRTPVEDSPARDSIRS